MSLQCPISSHAGRTADLFLGEIQHRDKINALFFKSMFNTKSNTSLGFIQVD